MNELSVQRVQVQVGAAVSQVWARKVAAPAQTSVVVPHPQEPLAQDCKDLPLLPPLEPLVLWVSR